MIEKLRVGDHSAFKELVAEQQKRVLNTCYRFVNNRQDAEDITQEVFIEVYRSISGFRKEAKLATWIYRIAVTKSLDFIRKNKRKKRIQYLRRTLGLENISEQVPAPTEMQADSTLEQQERFLVLQNALNSLAENQRTAITLGNYEAYTYQEIAEIMGTSVSAVESLIHRAKKNLKKKLHYYFEKKLVIGDSAPQVYRKSDVKNNSKNNSKWRSSEKQK